MKRGWVHKPFFFLKIGTMEIVGLFQFFSPQPPTVTSLHGWGGGCYNEEGMGAPSLFVNEIRDNGDDGTFLYFYDTYFSILRCCAGGDEATDKDQVRRLLYQLLNYLS